MFKLRTGAPGQPALGHTIRVYDAGTTDLVSGLIEPTLNNPQPISNPITVSGGFWGFQCPDDREVDIWWVEGDRYLLEGVPVRHLSLDLGSAAYLEAGTGPSQLLQLDEEGALPISEMDLAEASHYKAGGHPLLSYAPVQSVNGDGGHVVTNAVEYPNIPRRVYFVYGDSTDGGTTPDATVHASIDALIAAGIPANNIRWLYEVDDGLGGTLVVKNLVAQGYLEPVTLQLAGGTLSVNDLVAQGYLQPVTITEEGGVGNIYVLDLEAQGYLEPITLQLAGGTLSVTDLVAQGYLQPVTLTEEGGGGGLVVSDDFNRSNRMLVSDSEWGTSTIESFFSRLKINNNVLILEYNAQQMGFSVSWVDAVFSENQYAEAHIGASTSAWVGPSVRTDPNNPATSGYAIQGINFWDEGVEEQVAGMRIAAGLTSLWSTGTFYPYARIEAEGTTVRAYGKTTSGGSWQLLHTISNTTTYASGSPGINIFSESYATFSGFDDWKAGDL